MVRNNQEIKKSYFFSAFTTAIALLIAREYVLQNGQSASWIATLIIQTVLFFIGAGLFYSTRLKGKGLAWGFGFLFAAAQICGKRLDLYETIAASGADYLRIFIQAIICAPLAGGYVLGLLRTIAKRKNAEEYGKRKSTKAVFITAWLVLMCCWLPYLAAYYPGLYTYDVSYQFLQYSTGEFNTHHPLLHTLLIGWFYDLGWHLFGYPVKGILMYCIFQMALLAASMAGAIAFLYQKRVPKAACAVVLLVNALLPFNALLSISTTKDVLFSATVLWLTTLVLWAALEGWAGVLTERKWMLQTVVAVALTVLLRNNGFICAIALLAAGIWMRIMKVPKAIRLLSIVCVGMLLGAGTNAALKEILSAEKGPGREVFSIPVQQLARVYARTEDESKAEIEYFLPKASNYAPTIADAVKDTFRPEDTGVLPFLKLWAEVSLRHPQEYIDAFLETNQGFWDLGLYPAGQYLETKFHTDKGKWLMEDSKWPQLRETVSALYSQNEYWNLPVYRIILSPAFWTWLMLGALVLACAARKFGVLTGGMPVFALFLTTLLGPCVMLRYTYAVILCAPVLMAALLIPPKRRNAE